MTERSFHKIVILTGAGISADSGVATFRDKDGIWAKYDYRDVATPEGFARNPKNVLDFYNMRRELYRNVQPNAAHDALARLEQNFEGEVFIITQNIDGLHEAAGSKNLIHMHGEIAKRLCNSCGFRGGCGEAIHCDDVCPHCQGTGTLRPDVVWFGEMPYFLQDIARHLREADLFLSIGTSGNVYPAAGFVAEARNTGAFTIELNLEPSAGHSLFHEAIHGKAVDIIPVFVDQLLAGNQR